MILCPNCQSLQLVGAVFCEECGAQLVSQSESIIPSTDSRSTMMSTSQLSKAEDRTKEDIYISLQILNKGEVLDLAGQKEFTLGRISQGQTIIPDVDLSSFGAFQMGVSRLHATIIVGKQLTLTDLGSVNGTLLNGTQMPANMPVPITDGDVITLGRMEIRLLIKR